MKLSVITVNRNNAFGLCKTMDSVFCQSFRRFEFLVIDGASTDGSLEVLTGADKGSGNMGSVAYRWVSEKDQGIYDAMNKGIGMANGEYCLFLNSGDWLVHDHVLEDFFSRRPAADIVSGDVYFYDTEKQAVKWHIPSPDELTAKTLFLGTLPHQATLVKTELFNRLGLYSRKLKIASDWLFFVKALLENHCSYQHVPVTLSFFAMDGISCDPATRGLPRSEQLAVLQKKYPRFIADYERFRQLEENYSHWTESKDYQVYLWLKKSGIIRLGKLVIRVGRYGKRLLNKLTKDRIHV